MAEVVVGELRNHANRRSGSRVFRTSLEARSEVEKKNSPRTFSVVCNNMPSKFFAVLLTYRFRTTGLKQYGPEFAVHFETAVLFSQSLGLSSHRMIPARAVMCPWCQYQD